MSQHNTKVRISRCSNVALLSRAARLFLVWGSRGLADAAHVRSRQAMLENALRKNNAGALA